MRKETFSVTGMTCSACAARVERAVKKHAGTADVAVNLLTNTMTLSYDDAVTDPAAIIAAVEEAGYGAHVKTAPGTPPAGNLTGAQEGVMDTGTKEIRAMQMRLAWSILFLLPTMYTAMSHMFAMWGVPYPAGFAALFWGTENAMTFALTQFILILPIMYVNRTYYVNGFRSLLHP